MKYIYKWLFILNIIVFTKLSAQVASVTWPLTSNQNPNTPIGSITASPEIMGVGSSFLSTGAAANLMSIYGYNSFNNSGQELWVGNQGGTWVADPPAPATPLLDPLRFIQFNTAPTAGNNFTVTNISFKYGDDNNGVSNFNILAFKASYSINGFQTETFLNTNPLVYLNLTMSTFTAQNLNVIVPSGQTLSLRIYMYPVLRGIAMARTFAIHKDVIIEGRTTPVDLSNGSICGMKYNDLNGNGRKDTGELGLSGWTINLSMGAVQMTATTGTDGSYCFNNLAAGTYTLTETQQSGWQQTAPASPGTYTITLTPGTNLIGINFGNKEILNPNCTDFENGTSNGWQVNNTLMSIQQNGDNHFIQTTDQSGASSFFNSSKPLIGNWTNLISNGCGSLCFDVNFLYGGNPYNGVNPPQTFTPYIAIEGNGFSAAFIINNPIIVGDGWHSYCAPLSYLNSDGTLPSNSDGYWVMGVGTANDWNSLLSNVTKVRLPVDPTSYQNEKFGYDNICLKNTGDCNSPLKLGSICGIKIHDKNGDGVKDANEDGIPNWTITLTIGATTYTATTDATGNYCFYNLPAGTYTVSEVNQPNWRQIYPAQPGNYTITLLPGQEVKNINFSNVEDPTVQLGSICGIKFNDLNGDGDQDPGELGLPNWTFQLSGASNQTATTDLNGGFCFYNLKAGSYTIQEVIQNGWEPTVPNNTGTFSVTLLPGQNIAEIYFGNKEKLGSICGVKYNDLNGNGKKDDGEPFLSGWQISISAWGYTASGHTSGPTLTEIKVVTTDRNGVFCFDNLKPGSYLVGEYHQSGWTQTEPSTFAHSITLSPGQFIEGLNFGNKVDVSVRLGSICGIKFNDKNGNGRQDDGELGIP
ncbi:MAG: SdrD B-like domain-containing protein, partial [Ignavibacteria bacterium]|nr:SdrD B-like domain-containing protein [Ignavibacteria bacterium]